jgi:hypothetical protein
VSVNLGREEAREEGANGCECLRNPYLDVFMKYMQPPDPGEPFSMGWEPRSNCKFDYGQTIGYEGPEWEQYMIDSVNATTARWALTTRFAWAVPNEAAILAIAALGKPVVEIGAGTGYWGWLLDQVGVPTVLYDKYAGQQTYHREAEEWMPVRQGDHNALKHRWSGAALMLSWIPYGSPLGEECLRLFCGDTFVLVGERWGCCGTDDLNEMLPDEVGETKSGWTLTEDVLIPQWHYIHDYLSIYKR